MMRSLVSVRLLMLAAVIALGLLAVSPSSFGQVAVGISVGYAPPEIPVYEQPICPADGYIWTPGYWAWDGDDYYWVPGTWILAPEPGFFWTPPYWGWGGSAFFFHEGYWGPVVGFYGGINYGFGYFGHGYEGGRWDGGHFFYNRAVTNVNVTVIHNVYNTRVTNITENRVSYNGGQGGINARATAEEENAARERHIPPVAAQTQHIQQARANQQLRASVNHGRPPIAATARPGEFKGGVTPATSAARFNPPARGGNANAARAAAVHPNDLPPHEHQPAPNTGNPKTDQKYQQQQEKLYAKQEQEHQKLQQQQEKEHQQQMKKNANEAQKQQMEQRHQQQTQQMEQKHAQETQHMVEHQQPHQAPPPHEAPPRH
jgi:WXXGXW repeat (2 copies)